MKTPVKLIATVLIAITIAGSAAGMFSHAGDKPVAQIGVPPALGDPIWPPIPPPAPLG